MSAIAESKSTKPYRIDATILGNVLKRYSVSPNETGTMCDTKISGTMCPTKISSK